jgi:hypothetical protein
MKRLAFLLILGAIAAACSTSGSSADSGTSCPDVGRKCVVDSECCTKFCQVLGGGAFCIEKPATDPVCGGTGALCTQARHCCSRSCKNGACDPDAPPPPPPPCKMGGQACADSSECCVGVCVDEPTIGKRCGNAPPDGGTSDGGADAGDASADAASDASDAASD